MGHLLIYANTNGINRGIQKKYFVSNLVLELDLVIHKNKYDTVQSGISTEFSEDSVPP
jgi:hypothetical protein